jgi:putative DNA primase/helicase
MSAHAETIARALDENARRSSGGWWNSRCPVCQGEAKLGLKDGDRKLIVNCFKGCNPREILAELRRRRLWNRAAAKQFPNPDPEELQRRRADEAANWAHRRANARDMWEQTSLASGTIVEVYLWSRLIMISAPPEIRLHRSLWHKESGERRPAMVARVNHVEHGSVGVHVTWLQPDGAGKASLVPVRKTFGPIGGGAVQLGEPRPDNWLIVGEGLESTLSVMRARDLPGWAALSAGGIEHLLLPPEARMVLICADNDENGRGQRAANAAAKRWASEGRRVKIFMPPTAGTDWNDVLRGKAPARIGRGCVYAT